MRINNQRGFTLLEIIVAVAILTGMTLLLYTSMNSTLKAKVRVETRDDQLHGVRTALNKMVDDISQAVLANKVFWGTKSEYVTGMKGQDRELIFTTFGHYHYMADAKDTDQTMIAYELKSAQEGGYVLYRRELGRFSDKLEAVGDAYPVLEDISEFKFSYYDSNKKEWVGEWDSSQLSVLGRLPLAVKIELTLVKNKEDDNNKKDAEVKYSTTALVESYNSEINF